MTDSLIPLTEDDIPMANAPVDSAEAPQNPAKDPSKDPEPAPVRPRQVTYKGQTYEVPVPFWDGDAQDVNLPALLKSHHDLRRRISQMPKAPECYELTIPDDLQDRISAGPDDPLTKAAMDWARRHNLSQDAFNELTETFMRHEAGTFDPDAYRTAQDAALGEALGDRKDAVCQEIGQWFGAVMGPEFQRDPNILAAAEELASDARGVLFLKALRDRLVEHDVPGAATTAPLSLDEAALRRLQASDAYMREGHPDHQATVRQVQAGWRRLTGG